MGNEFIKITKYLSKIIYYEIIKSYYIMKTIKIFLKKKSNKRKKNNFTRKKNNILSLQPINQFHKTIYLKTTGFKKDFLSSCFKYYYGNIKICNKNELTSKSCKNIGLTNSFLHVTNKGALVIIDYPNIIHILYEEYKDKSKVIQTFYEFIYQNLKVFKTKF